MAEQRDDPAGPQPRIARQELPAPAPSEPEETVAASVPTISPDRAGPAVPARSGSAPRARVGAGLLGEQRDMGEAALGDDPHQFHDAAVRQVLVAAHEDAPVRVVRAIAFSLSTTSGSGTCSSCR